MTGKQLRQYCFKNESHWKTCLFSQTDRAALGSDHGFRPFPPYAGEPTQHYESPGARAPVVLRTGEILWCDNQGMLHRSSTDDVTSEAFPAPPSIASASRVVSIAGSLWVSAEKTYTRELLGRSGGAPTPNMSVRLARSPVLHGTLELRVKEPLDEKERKALLEADAANVLTEVDGLTGTWIDWVLWKQVDDPNDEPENARVYALDESNGEIRFGDGRHGRIPPIGRDSIVAFSYKQRSESLECYDEETLTRLINVDPPNAYIIDIAAGDKNSLFVLLKQDGELQCIHLSGSGHKVDTVSFNGISRAKAFIFLRRSQQFVVLTGDHQPRLCWFSAAGGEAVSSKPIGTIQPCFKAELLGTDSVDKVILAGNTSDETDTQYSVFALDAGGDLLGQVPLGAPATGIAATRQSLIVTDAGGLLRYATADAVPDTPAEVRCTLITPLLQSLNPEGDSPWLRVDSSATLPEGTTLEISYAATDKSEDRDRLKAIAEDVRLPPSQRIQKLLSEPDLWSSKTIFHGSDRKPEVPDAPRSAPLFDVRGRYLWVCVTLTAVRGARLPTVTELAVLYSSRSLMENLPMPYRRAAAQPGDFLRSLVGVLEATTQDLDTRIAALGSHIHPATAAQPWMDYIARWLGLPWDDALTDDQKRAILHSAAELARGRGTRAGLETLLECLLPGSPRRFRVTDTTVDFGYAVVGGDRCTGSALPAQLGGFTRWHAELDSTTVLGYTCLPCPAQGNNRVQWPARKLRIEVSAGYTEREASEPWLLTLITEMVPLTVSVDLRWVSAQALRTDRLDDTLVLEAPPSPHLGTDAVIGLARLPEQRRTRLTGSEPATGARLR